MGAVLPTYPGSVRTWVASWPAGDDGMGRRVAAAETKGTEPPSRSMWIPSGSFPTNLGRIGSERTGKYWTVAGANSKIQCVGGRKI